MATALWRISNRDRWVCSRCNFSTYSKSHYFRHLTSDKHFLLTEFHDCCPRELRIVIASFLPFYLLSDLKCIGPAALKLAWQQPHRLYPLLLYPVRSLSINPPVQTAGGVAWTIDNARRPTYAVIL